MTTVASSFMAGAAAGFLVAAPIGPTSLYCIQRTIGDGFGAGLATGLGVASVHLTYGALALLTGLTFSAFEISPGLSGLLAGLVLLAFAIRAVTRVIDLDPASRRKQAVGSAYLGAVAFGFLNPLTPLLFIGLSPGLARNAGGFAPVVLAGVFLGSFVWWSMLTGGVSCLRARLTFRVLKTCNKIAGVLLGVMAISIAAGGFSRSPDHPPPRGGTGEPALSEPAAPGDFGQHDGERPPPFGPEP